MKIYLRTVLLVGLGAALGLLAGRLLGPHWGWGVASSVLLALLAHHVWQFQQLTRWAKLPSGSALPDGSGLWEETFTTLHRRQRADIRRRRRFARLFARSRQAGRALPYGLTILGPDRRIVWCNGAAESHFAVDGERDLGQPITHLIRQPEFVAYVESGGGEEPLEIVLSRSNEVIVSVQLVPYVEDHHLLISRDVTQAYRVRVMRRDFVANVSHELRTPLTVLVGFLETVRDLKLDPQRTRDYLNLMAEQGRRMQVIIEDLLTLSTLESAPPPQEDTVNVVELLAQVETEARSLSGGKHVIEINADPRLKLRGDASELLSAFTNLANNAVRYTPEGGAIQMSWVAFGEEAEFRVKDEGIGIAAEHIPRLTERFYRVDRGRSRETGGTGLGLAIVKHVLARHQATLHITSTPGKGSTFIARFPAARIINDTSPTEHHPNQNKNVESVAP
jgi:two-component system, OmpR family, phosphate regulon sensor histidine kinase PhoR